VVRHFWSNGSGFVWNWQWVVQFQLHIYEGRWTVNTLSQLQSVEYNHYWENDSSCFAYFFHVVVFSEYFGLHSRQLNTYHTPLQSTDRPLTITAGHTGLSQTLVFSAIHTALQLVEILRLQRLVTHWSQCAIAMALLAYFPDSICHTRQTSENVLQYYHFSLALNTLSWYKDGQHKALVSWLVGQHGWLANEGC